jgi:Cof subfamily protein (haloacid dehalogenase superfamily)
MITQNEKKIIVYFDIDGTLIDSANSIALSQATADAIAELKRRGHLVAVNTGRSYAFIPPEVRALDFDAYIAGCGTYISYRGETILNEYFSHADVDRIISAFRAERLDMILEGPEHVYLEAVGFDPLMMADSRHLFHESHSLKTLPQETVRANKISFMVKSGEKDRRIRESLKDLLHFILYPYELREGMPHGFTKASGMDVLERVIGGEVRSYAFGDSVNDLDMLQRANVGIAMGNGQESAKAVSDLVAPPLAENGIARMLKQLKLIEG